jgi:methionyl-tRNA formyltransferase
MMPTQLSVVVFAYAFPHRKTHDFLLALAAAGVRNVAVVAAPWKPLRHNDPTEYFPRTLQPAPPLPARDLCQGLGMRYLEAAHDDVEAIARLQKECGAEIAIIAGARILKPEIIDLFGQGIANFHPGKLPETAGLDAFYRTLACDIPAGVTAHFIDWRVDAGQELFFEEAVVNPHDGPESVLHNTYQRQIAALRRFLAFLREGPPTGNPIERSRPNPPMTKDEKRAATARFADWRAGRVRAQIGEAVLEACRTGDSARVRALLLDRPDLIEFRSAEGWTPLIVAAFNQQTGAVRALLELGANPDTAGRNGTTPLMYAKTALLNDPDSDYEVLNMLLDAGADPTRRDRHGRDLEYYITDAQDRRMLEWLSRMRKAV